MTSQIHVDEEAASYAREALQIWAETSARDFPWRGDKDPYHVLMAEMMLRRTQARQVVDVYLRFVERYPTVQALHLASAEDVSAALRPLGLNWRAANFKVLARELM